MKKEYFFIEENELQESVLRSYWGGACSGYYYLNSPFDFRKGKDWVGSVYPYRGCVYFDVLLF